MEPPDFYVDIKFYVFKCVSDVKAKTSSSLFFTHFRLVARAAAGCAMPPRLFRKWAVDSMCIQVL